MTLLTAALDHAAKGLRTPCSQCHHTCASLLSPAQLRRPVLASRCHGDGWCTGGHGCDTATGMPRCTGRRSGMTQQRRGAAVTSSPAPMTGHRQVAKSVTELPC